MNLSGKAEVVSLQCAVWQVFKKNVATDATETVNLFIINGDIVFGVVNPFPSKGFPIDE